MSGTEVMLASIGKAADDLGLGMMEIETSEVRFYVRRGGRDMTVTVRAENYGPVTGEMLRALITPTEATDAAR